MSDSLLKGVAIICGATVTLTCIAVTIFLAVFFKAYIRSLPPPINYGSYGPMGMMNGMPPTGRSWGPEQATGEPNTTMAGDQITAWASLTTDFQDEWLTLTYKDPVTPVAVLVHETFNPGAVTKVTSVDGDKETTLWEGKDPVKIEYGKGVAEIPVTVPSPITSVKIYLNSKNVPGWNEIDAVGLKAADDTVQWATEAKASSTFAEQPPMGMMPGDPTTDRLNGMDQRLKALEDGSKAKK